VNINIVALLLAASGLIGYFLMLMLFPMLTFERLLFLASSELPAIFMHYWDKHQKRKREMEKN
jgi:hypothetical protein